jgi:hypothetical protein
MKKMLVLFVLIAIFVLILANLVGGGSGGSGSSGSSNKELNVQINFSDTQFLISNNNSFDYTNVRMKVNDKYELTADKISAGQQYIVGMAQFADSSGQRFNPFAMKVRKIYIRANEGYQYGESN